MSFLKEQKAFIEAVIMSRTVVLPGSWVPEKVRLAAEDTLRENVEVKISPATQVSLAWAEARKKGLSIVDDTKKESFLLEAVSEIHWRVLTNPDKELDELIKVESNRFKQLLSKVEYPKENGIQMLYTNPDFNRMAVEIYTKVIKPILKS